MKSKRWASSLRAWFQAFSTSIMLSSLTTSKLGIRPPPVREPRAPAPPAAPRASARWSRRKKRRTAEPERLLHLAAGSARRRGVRPRQRPQRLARGSRLLVPLEPGHAPPEELRAAHHGAGAPGHRQHHDAEAGLGEQAAVLYHEVRHVAGAGSSRDRVDPAGRGAALRQHPGAGVGELQHLAVAEQVAALPPPPPRPPRGPAWRARWRYSPWIGTKRSGRTSAAGGAAPPRGRGRRRGAAGVLRCATTAPRRHRSLTSRPTASSLPGMRRDESTTVSPGATARSGCSPRASAASAERGSPWVPVVSTHGSRGGSGAPRRGRLPGASSGSRGPSASSKVSTIPRPSSARRRPLAAAASTTCCSRWTLEAKVATKTRPGASSITSARAGPTSDSERVLPGRSALVESERSRRTPAGRAPRGGPGRCAAGHRRARRA